MDSAQHHQTTMITHKRATGRSVNDKSLFPVICIPFAASCWCWCWSFIDGGEGENNLWTSSSQSQRVADVEAWAISLLCFCTCTLVMELSAKIFISFCRCDLVHFVYLDLDSLPTMHCMTDQ